MASRDTPPPSGLEYPKLDQEPTSDDTLDRVLNRADSLLSRDRGGSSTSATPADRSASDRNASDRIASSETPGRFEARGSSRRATSEPPPVVDFPVLTEVVPGRPKPPTAQDLMLDEIENELRLELLGQMQPELERLIESRVHQRLDQNIAEIMAQTRDQLVTEVRRAVRESLSQVLGEEIKRLRAAKR
jgi:hypothetical protein